MTAVKARSGAIPAGFGDTAIQSYIDEAKLIMLGYCTLPQNIQEVPDDLFYAWAEIATVLMWGGAFAGKGKLSAVKEGDVSLSFAAGKFNGSGVDFSKLDNIGAMNRYRTLS